MNREIDIYLTTQPKDFSNYEKMIYTRHRLKLKRWHNYRF